MSASATNLSMSSHGLSRCITARDSVRYRIWMTVLLPRLMQACSAGRVSAAAACHGAAGGGRAPPAGRFGQARRSTAHQKECLRLLAP